MKSVKLVASMRFDLCSKRRECEKIYAPYVILRFTWLYPGYCERALFPWGQLDIDQVYITLTFVLLGGKKVIQRPLLLLISPPSTEKQWSKESFTSSWCSLLVCLWDPQHCQQQSTIPRKSTLRWFPADMTVGRATVSQHTSRRMLALAYLLAIGETRPARSGWHRMWAVAMAARNVSDSATLTARPRLTMETTLSAAVLLLPSRSFSWHEMAFSSGVANPTQAKHVWLCNLGPYSSLLSQTTSKRQKTTPGISQLRFYIQSLFLSQPTITSNMLLARLNPVAKRVAVVCFSSPLLAHQMAK